MEAFGPHLIHVLKVQFGLFVEKRLLVSVRTGVKMEAFACGAGKRES